MILSSCLKKSTIIFRAINIYMSIWWSLMLMHSEYIYPCIKSNTFYWDYMYIKKQGFFIKREGILFYISSPHFFIFFSTRTMHEVVCPVYRRGTREREQKKREYQRVKWKGGRKNEKEEINIKSWHGLTKQYSNCGEKRKKKEKEKKERIGIERDMVCTCMVWLQNVCMRMNCILHALLLPCGVFYTHTVKKKQSCCAWPTDPILFFHFFSVNLFIVFFAHFFSFFLFPLSFVCLF